MSLKEPLNGIFGTFSASLTSPTAPVRLARRARFPFCDTSPISWNERHGRSGHTPCQYHTGATRFNDDSTSQLTCCSAPVTIDGALNRTGLLSCWQSADHRSGWAVYINNPFNQRHVVNGNTVYDVLGTPYASSLPRFRFAEHNAFPSEIQRTQTISAEYVV